MCDFHSIAVRRDGAKAYIMSNSHSGAVEAAKWRENQPNRDAFFVECEGGGLGKFPGVEQITRGEPNEKQAKVITDHYTSLAALLADPAAHGEGMLLPGGIFAGEEYGDIRWKVLIDARCPKRLADKLAATRLHADGSTISSLHPAVTEIGGTFCVAKSHSLTAPALTEVTGYVSLEQGASLTAPALTEVTGYVSLEQGASLTAPALTEVTGYVSLGRNTTFIAPKLKKGGKA